MTFIDRTSWVRLVTILMALTIGTIAALKLTFDQYQSLKAMQYKACQASQARGELQKAYFSDISKIYHAHVSKYDAIFVVELDHEFDKYQHHLSSISTVTCAELNTR